MRAKEQHMAGETVITVIGNLTADPDVRFTAAGATVAKLHRGVDAAHVQPDQR